MEGGLVTDTAKTLTACLYCLVIICSTALILAGRTDAASLGILATLALQAVTYMTVNQVHEKVNGQMTRLLDERKGS
jgi:hypothetical protein